MVRVSVRIEVGDRVWLRSELRLRLALEIRLILGSMLRLILELGLRFRLDEVMVEFRVVVRFGDQFWG